MADTLLLDRTQIEALFRIGRYRAKSRQDLFDVVLKETVLLTQSIAGYIFFYDNPGGDVSLDYQFQKNIDTVSVTHPQTKCKIEKAGVWGKAILQGHTVLLNDSRAASPVDTGDFQQPAGFKRLLAFPVASDQKIVAVIGLAGKETDYTDSDAEVLRLVSDDVFRCDSLPATATSENQDTCREFLENIEEGCFETDLKGNFTFSNTAAARMIGYHLDQVVGSNFRNFVKASDSERILSIFNQVFKTGTPTFLGKMETVNKNGSMQYLDLMVSPIIDAAGHITGFRSTARDMTEQARFQAEQERFREFLENIDDGCFETDIEGNFTYCNEAGKANIGYAGRNVIGLNYRSYTNAHGAGKILNLFHEVYETGVPANITDCEVMTPDGKAVHLELTVSLIRQAGGKPIGFRGTSRNVTEKRAAQEALRQSQERYHTLFQRNMAVMLLIDPDTISIIEANDAACLYYGCSRDEIVQKKLSDISTLPEAELRSKLSDAAHLLGGRLYQHHRVAGGDIHPVEVFTGPMQLDGRRLLYLMVYDIRQRREAEEALQRSEEKYRRILEDMTDGYYETDLSGVVVFCNRAGASLMGYLPEEMLGADFRLFAPEKAVSEIRRVSESVYKTGNPSNLFDHAIIRKDGTVRIHQVNVGLVRNAKGDSSGFRIVARDMTERKRAEEELARSEQRIRVLFNNIPMPTLVWKVYQDRFLLAEYNDAVLQFSGGKILPLIGRTAEECFPRAPQVSVDMRQCFYERTPVEKSLWINFDEDSEKRYLAIRYAFAPPDNVIMHIHDTTAQKRAEENLQFISVHDSLTGLYNRFYTDAEIERIVSSRLRPVSVIIIDLNNLKTINDQFGHATGDLYIRNAASLLRQTFRPEDLVARIGGDEFMVILPLVDEQVCVQAVARLKENMMIFNKVTDKPLSLAVGVATAYAGDDFLDCVKIADKRMYENKSGMKSQSDRAAYGPR